MSGSNALQITDPNADNPLAQAPSWADAYANVTGSTQNPISDLQQWLAAQRAKSAKMGLWDDQTGLPTGKGLVSAAGQYGNALMMGTAAPGESGPLGQLVSHWGAADKVPYNEGGQQINMFLPDGRVSTADLPSHPMMLQTAGIPGTLEDFMATTGAIRSHGPDNYDIRRMPTNQQIMAMSRYARDNGHTDVWVDTPSASDSVRINRLSAFLKDAFEAQ